MFDFSHEGAIPVSLRVAAVTSVNFRMAFPLVVSHEGLGICFLPERYKLFTHRPRISLPITKYAFSPSMGESV